MISMELPRAIEEEEEDRREKCSIVSRARESVEDQIKLQKACLCGEIEKIQFYLNEPNQVFLDSRTALFYAVESGNTKAVAYVLSCGGNPCLADEDQTRPLHLASNHAEMCALLLKYDADPNAQMRSGATSLILAAQNGALDTVRILLQDPKTKILVEDNNKASALYFAAKNGHFEIVQLLIFALQKIKAEYTIDQFTHKGSWPLHAAVVKGHLRVVSLLLDNGANPNQCTKQGKSLISIAAEEGASALIEVLLDRASLQTPYFDHHSSFWPIWLAVAGGYRDIAMRLIARGANPNHTLHNAGTTPFHFAAYYGNIHAIYILLSIHADPNIQDYSGATPLFYACQNAHTTIISKLLQVVSPQSINALAVLRSNLAPPQSLDDIQPKIYACAFLILLAPLDTISFIKHSSEKHDLTHLLLSHGAKRRRRYVPRCMASYYCIQNSSLPTKLNQHKHLHQQRQPQQTHQSTRSSPKHSQAKIDPPKTNSISTTETHGDALV